MAAPPPLRLGAPGGLSIIGRRTPSSEEADAINPMVNGLGAGQRLERMLPEETYYSNVFKIIGPPPDSAVQGVRKVAYKDKVVRGLPAPHIYVDTKTEKAIYDDLRTKHGFRDHVMPYRAGAANNDSVYLNFHWKQGSDMIEYINGRGHAYTDAEKKYDLYHIASSLKWLGSHGYIHRDMKFDNLYRDLSGHIYLFDFGMAKKIEEASSMDLHLEISNFVNKLITPLALASTSVSGILADVLVTTLSHPPPHGGNVYAKAILAFYDAMIARYRPHGQGGGRRVTRRHRHRR
jgi:serine/threonine protein kinase